MELFVHSADNEHPEVIEVEVTTLVRTLLLEEDAEGRIWLEEIDEEIDLDVTLEVAGIGHHHHVHRGHCHRVDVAIRFNDQRFEHHFGPAQTIATVKKWAFGPHAANLSAEQAAKHVLAVPGADHFLDDDVHIGSLTKESCAVKLDALPRARFAG